MLTLNNIEKLKGTHIGKWKVVGVEECDKNECPMEWRSWLSRL